MGLLVLFTRMAQIKPGNMGLLDFILNWDSVNALSLKMKLEASTLLGFMAVHKKHVKSLGFFSVMQKQCMTLTVIQRGKKHTWKGKCTCILQLPCFELQAAYLSSR